MRYTVIVDDNGRYMDEEARCSGGEFESWELAEAACKNIVDDFLASAYRPGMSAGALYSQYKMFGEDPWISGGGGFSAWDYAEQRSKVICGEVVEEAEAPPPRIYLGWRDRG